MKTTKAHFAIFKEQVEIEQRKWGLLGWSLNVVHQKCDSPNSLAEVGYATKLRTAMVILNTEWLEAVTEEQLRLAAFHEIWEIMLADHYVLAVDPTVTYAQKTEMVEAASHQIIRTLENVVGYEKVRF